ncbi:NERD domain-containing protein [Proteus terrae]|uniref:NERD domain-containing protein n=1 Tax=Proteus terrae TaxID=1574161 RepID=UPI001C606520|nr:NERD domain-containing protein [Proteus terrae]
MIKKLGAFRASKYGYKVNLLKEVIFDIYKKIDFKDIDKNYINNVINLSLLSPDILSLKNKIQSFIKSRPDFLKNALAIAEIKFHDINNFFDPSEMSLQDSLYYANRESFISSVSYTLQLFKEIKPNINGMDSIYVENCSMDKAYLKIFYDAYLIQIFNESEINVDFFEYNVDVCNNKIILKNEDFEYILRQGYAKSKLRWTSINLRLLQDKEAVYFSEFMDNLCKDGLAEENLYIIKKEPIERIVLKALLNNNKEDLFRIEKLFFEEMVMLQTISLENYNTDFIDMKIFKDFTVFDIIKMQRFFNYISYIYNHGYKELVKKKEVNADLIRKRSILPVMNTLELAKIFSHITDHSTEDCLSIISKISIDFSDKNEALDLQYNPIIKIEDASLILPTVFSYSNLIRSFSLNENVNLSTFKNKDYMVDSIKNTLEQAGFYVKSDFSYGNDEIDILAFLDNSLFIFECKNPYHPVNPFELRNTYSHIQKGFKQINKLKKILSNKESLKQLLLNAGMSSLEVKEIYYGVINANRVLCGLSKDNIKVYHANELINLIETGDISCMYKKYNVWEKNKFTLNDLVRYLNGDIIISDFENIKLDISYEYPLREHYMVLLTNAFEIHELPIHMEKKYNSN